MKYEVYIGSFSSEEQAAILKGIFNDETGELSITDSIPAVRPSYLCMNADKTVLYCVNEAKTADGEPGGVESYDISSGSFCRLSAQSTHSEGPCYLCICDSHLLVCNYAGGSVTQFELKDDRILPTHCIIQHYGHGTDPDRQTQPHVHFAALSPDRKYLAVCDLGTDSIFLYPYSAENGISPSALRLKAPAGCGPRHLLFRDDGKYLYVIAEMGSSILVYDLQTTPAKLIQNISARVSDVGHSQCAGIRFTPDKKGIAAANRGEDTLTFFGIDEENGTLSYDCSVETGLWPRDHCFSPDGNWLFSADQDDDSIGIYRYHKDAAPIFKQKLQLTVGYKPSSIVFGNVIEI